jgi:beta-mannosidase
MTDRAARQRRHLHEGWTVIRTGGTADPPANLPSSPITAAVPGVVHLDLIHEDVLPHPDRGDGEAAQAWVGRSDWRYARTITADDVAFGDVNDGDIVELVFDSIDTVATVRLGERVLGSV